MSNNPSHSLVTGEYFSQWPVVVVIEDCYVPQFARTALKRVEASTLEVNYTLILALAVYAEAGLRRERLN